VILFTQIFRQTDRSRYTCSI